MKSQPHAMVPANRHSWRYILSAVLFMAMVSPPVKQWLILSEEDHLSSLQAIVYLIISIAGMLPGFSLQPKILEFATGFSQALLQNDSDERRVAYLHRTAVIILIISMIASLLWTNSALNQFVDLHRGLYVEANLLVYIMGFVTSIAWILLLKRYALYGILFTSTMMMMMIANLLASHSF
ncbi:MAG: hypothetical protein OWR52_10465 [Acidibacillus sp.]|uniref:Uncharacterized protein n=1 Tax=Sulfoacidibacillus ferrooxidans TaxID=2005001 RepID=A0A9X1V767_9BACL|nr:hypothetical protein [Sulfoacidibacillus ferrooxidans]MCI0182269.1 hypothetical protein [Sulfoacidibacillus ferrooxidans]MCY0893917.1 hypothetical protein [Acidibacillus sp.]